MNELPKPYCRPLFTKTRLGGQILFALGAASFLAIIAGSIGWLASGRVESGLLLRASYALLSQSIEYCFGVIAVTLMSLMLVEVAFRKPIGFLQYSLIAMALTLFYLLLLALSEKMAFGWSYAIVSLMTIAMNALFIKGITQSAKAAALTAGILIAEYGLMFVLINLGAMKLLVGSLLLFVILALAMYFTLKLRVVNEELTIK